MIFGELRSMYVDACTVTWTNNKLETEGKDSAKAKLILDAKHHPKHTLQSSSEN